MVIIVVSNIHGMIKLTNGLLLINSYNEGMNSILSVLNDSLRSDIFHDNKPIDNTMEDTKENKAFSLKMLK